MGRIKTTSELELIAGSTISSTSIGATTINSGTSAMGLSTDASATTVSVGTGSAAKTVIIGSQTSTSATTIDAGTGALNIGTAIAKTITVGNTTGATAVNINVGTGGYTMTSGSGTLISQLAAGSQTRPLQPAFLSYLPTSDANATGNSATYTLGGTTALTEVFDQGSNITTAGVFTAPVTGRYFFVSCVRLTAITAAMISGFFSLVTSNRTYLLGDIAPGLVKDAASAYAFTSSAFTDMDAADTTTVTVQLTGGVGNTAGVNGSSSAFTFIAGYLVC